MRYFLQGNANGYVVCVTNDEVLIGLFGGTGKEVSAEIAASVQTRIDAMDNPRLEEVQGLRDVFVDGKWVFKKR